MAAEVIREGEPGRTYSTSPGLSSPPKSPESPNHSSAIHLAQPGSNVAYPNLPSHHISHVDGGDDSGSQTITVNAKASKATAAAAPVKKTRKKREPANTTGASTPTEVKEKKTRKPRAPAGTTNPRKKVKTEVPEEAKPVATQGSRQAKITELVGSAQPQPGPATVAPSRTGNNEAIPKNDSPALSASGPAMARSGQNYDPIRSSTVETPRQFTNPFSGPQSSPLKSANRASASPSISSLIDPPNTSPVTYPFTQSSHLSKSNTPHDFNPPSMPQMSPPTFVYGDTQLRPPTSTSPSTMNLLPVKPFQLQNAPAPLANTESTPMEIDFEVTAAQQSKPAQTGRKPSTGTSTGPASATHSPKPARPKDKDLNLPPLPSGNGLLPSSLFGGPASTMPEKQAPTIILNVPLNGEINKYVNFARMAEERYGFNALHPRLAAQRERLARVAAAGALLEKTSSNGGASGVSADEMSLELSEGEGDNGGDSNVEMGGMATGDKKLDPNSKEGLKPVRKRRMKEDQYDKEDPFVDDSELAWEEQAAASKDGFFVYSGPLVPEGEKPVVERYVTSIFASTLYLTLPSFINTSHFLSPCAHFPASRTFSRFLPTHPFHVTSLPCHLPALPPFLLTSPLQEPYH